MPPSDSDKLVDQAERLAAIKLALEARGLGRPDKVLDVIARLCRYSDLPDECDDRRPTRLLVDAIKTEAPH